MTALTPLAPPATTLGAAGHVAVRALVAGPPAAATPLAATRAGVILAVPGHRPVSVVSCDAVRLPGALVLASPSTRLRLAELGPGTPAQVGRGFVRLGDLRVQPTRWWSTHAVRAARHAETVRAAIATLERTLDARRGDAHWASDALRTVSRPFREAMIAAVGTWVGAPGRRAAASAADDAVSAAIGLLGLGPGLTPSGDDLVAATLVTVARLAPDAAPLAAHIGVQVASAALTRTTGVSAALLTWAGAGEACPELVSLLDAIARGGDLAPGLRALLAVGHTSGRDLARGVVVGATAVHALLACPPTRASA